MSGRVRTVFLGSGEFAVPVAAALVEHPQVELAAVVTAPARPAGRRRTLSPTPVGRWAADSGLATHTPGRLREPAALATLADLAPELLVLADYGQMVPRALLELPRHRALNLHPSLLPRHRGASPIAAAILAGDEETGVTLMAMDEGLDSGPIIAQRRVELRGDETAPELEERLAAVAAGIVAGHLGEWLRGELEAHPQPAAGMTLTRPLRRADGALDPRRPAAELERQVRAYQPWPGSYLDTDAGRLAVWRARPAHASGARGESVGTILSTAEGEPALVTGAGLLELVEVQPAGGRRMGGAELLRGRPALVGMRVTMPPAADTGTEG
ncbi:MAG TPA: methionyl-tRNA formyltransferase [Candidatus Limnocylindrales bacterium]